MVKRLFSFLFVLPWISFSLVAKAKDTASANELNIKVLSIEESQASGQWDIIQ